MIKLKKVKVNGNNIEAFYEDDNGIQVEVVGEFEIKFFKGDEPEVKLIFLDKIISECKHCQVPDFEQIDLGEVNTHSLEDDIMNQIDIDDYKEYSL